MADHSQDWDIGRVRELLLSAFTAETLRRFCQDRPIFQPIFPEFGPGQGLDDMADRVIDYCQTHVLLAELLAAVKEENPRQYDRLAPFRPPTGLRPMVPGPARQLRPAWWWAIGAVVVLLVLIPVGRHFIGGGKPTPTLTPTAPVATLPPTDTPTPGPTADATGTAAALTATAIPLATAQAGTATAVVQAATATAEAALRATQTAAALTAEAQPRPNPDLGTFQTTFDEKTELLYVAYGPTLGGQSMCAFHNLRLAQSDVGKQLTFYVRDLDVTAPSKQPVSKVLDVYLYRSLAGRLSAGDTIDMWQQPNAEEVVGPIDNPFDRLTWQVTRPGDYVICLLTPVNTFYSQDYQFNFANYTVLLSGG